MFAYIVNVTDAACMIPVVSGWATTKIISNVVLTSPQCMHSIVCPCLRRSSRQFRSPEMAPVPTLAPGRGSKPLETAHRAPASVAPRVAPVRFRSLPAVCTRR
jgi:hypothetical protein